MIRGEIWWADLGPHRSQEQTGRRPVVIWQSNALNGALHSVLVVPLTTNLARAKLAGTAFISATPDGPPADSVALAFQLRHSEVGTPRSHPLAHRRRVGRARTRHG